jgi:transposase
MQSPCMGSCADENQQPSAAGGTTTRSRGNSTSAPRVGGFPPSDPDRQALIESLHQPPEATFPDSPEPLPPRWSLALARKLCPALATLKTDSGVWRRLRRWKITYKVGRVHIISPDPAYQEKCAAIDTALERARADPDRVRLLYADEVTYYRRPERGCNWGTSGSGGRMQPKVNQAPGSNTKRRIIGALDAVDGRTCTMSRSTLGVRPICAYLHQVRKAYGPEIELIIAWDNWPPHHAPDVLTTAAKLNIQLLYTPTYAPWTNAIEKLWDLLKDEVLRLHRLSDKWTELRKRVDTFLANLQKPNPALLRKVGLSST